MSSATVGSGSADPVRLDWREACHAGLAILLVAVLTRLSTYGHPNLYADETFYFAAGLDTLHGAIPYVDIWDRKPPGHFLLFTLIAALSSWYVTYQIVATGFAAVTAWVIYLAARQHASITGSIMGAVTYLVAICLFNGEGGQSAVFYNMFMALAAFLVIHQARSSDASKTDWQIAMAMLAAGIAITIKTTAIFEAVYFGLFTTMLRIQAHGLNAASVRRTVLWAALGALPTLLFAAWYFINGYWQQYWVAMVLSNLRKPVDEAGTFNRMITLAGVLSLYSGPAIVWLLKAKPPVHRIFYGGWLVAALVGFLSVPAMYLHYALPLLVPLCICAAGFYQAKPVGQIWFAVSFILTIYFTTFNYSMIDLNEARFARANMARLVTAIEESKGDGPLLVFNGPPLLYPLTHSPFPSPLAFPNHLHQLSERNVSQFNTLAEVERILAKRPGAIVDRNTAPKNEETTRLVRAYEHRYCKQIASVPLETSHSHFVQVWGDCRSR